MEVALRQRLRRVVLDSDTRPGRIYNLVIFGTILLSVAGLLIEPHPLRVATPGEIPSWVEGLERLCLLVFMGLVVRLSWEGVRRSRGRVLVIHSSGLREGTAPVEQNKSTRQVC